MDVSAQNRRNYHSHTAVTTHVLRQRAGVPYEVERVTCETCRRLLGERAVRRAAA
jgi:NMD protein affecting ribosome stability and mRNA decay